MLTGFRSTIVKMAGLVLVSAGLAFLANRYGPRRIPWVQDWAHHVEQLAKADGIQVVPLFDAVRALDEKSALFVDARSASAFAGAHIQGAVNVPAGDLQEMVSLMNEERLMIIYCDGQGCDDALNLCRELRANDVANVRLLADGMEMWSRFDLAVETGG